MQPSIVPESLARSFFTDDQRQELCGPHFTAVNNDCVQEMPRLEPDSVDLIHTSIPFGNHYEYSALYNDFGHNTDNDRFFDQMDWLTPELLRVLKPGRIAAIHVKDRIRFGNVTGFGFPTSDTFSDDTSRHFRKHGFKFMGRITVVTDVVRENNQTYRLGWTECCKDGTKMGVGMSEYVLLFRKLPTDTSKAYADEPVTKEKAEYSRGHWQVDAHGFWRSSGRRLLRADQVMAMPMEQQKAWFEQFSIESPYDYHDHVSLCEEVDSRGRLPSSFMLFPPASPDPNVWTDVNRMRTLNSEQTRKQEENHICPLQLDIVERIINRYTNPGDLVLDPFGGLMTVPYMAVKMGRRGYGIELNPEYWRMGCGYCRKAEAERNIPSLFNPA